jgi:Tfp pilus assembly protein PilE
MEAVMSLKSFKKLNSKGFSIVELAVVTGMIGVLAAVAIPQFDSYRQKAHNASAESDLHNVKTALECYYVEHKVYP